MDFLPETSGPPLEPSKEKAHRSQNYAQPSRKITPTQMSGFTPYPEWKNRRTIVCLYVRWSEGSYRADVGMSSSAWRIESNCGTQYIKGGGMVPGKPEDKNYYQGELGGQLWVMCAIEIMDSIFSGTKLVVNSCDNISVLRQASIHL